MKVKATTNFAGEICMAKGDVRDVPESVAAPLLECGYLEALEPVQTSEQKRAGFRDGNHAGAGNGDEEN